MRKNAFVALVKSNPLTGKYEVFYPDDYLSNSIKMPFAVRIGAHRVIVTRQTEKERIVTSTIRW